MRVIGVMADGYGGPEALRMFEVPDPVAGTGQVLVRVHAATVNPTDTYFRNGGRSAQQKDAGPFVPGMDVAGVVEALGT
jgi:NADPH:quinone reductase